MPDSLLLKFQKLPDPVKANASDPVAMHMLDTLEKDYSVNLAELVMRVMVQEVDPARLDEVLEKQYSVPAGKGKELAKHLLDDLFFKFRLLDVPDVKDTLTAELPKPPLQPQAGASPYLVHPDDHKDLVPHVALLATAPPPRVDTDPTQVAAKLLAMERAQLDPMLLKRFQKIVESRLVDVRDKLESRDMFLRPTKIGGMGFDEARTDRMVSELDKVVEVLHRRPKEIVKPPPAPKPVVPKPPVTPSPVLRTSSPAGGEEGIKAVATLVVPKPKVAPPPWLRPTQAPAPMTRPATAPIARPATPQPAPSQRPAPSYREVVTDVRAPAKVMGPIEVLGSLSLDDFRRLGATPGEQVRKIIDEVEALGRDSFAQRAAGIAAFRQSPTFKAYLALGQQSMERKEEVADIIDLLRARGTPALTAAEFEAIGALMRTFRY